MYLMAIDIGSTSIKAVIYDYEGNLIESGRRKTEVSFEEKNGEKYAFWDPDNIWNSVYSSIKEATSKIKDPEKIKGIAVTGFACDGVPIDEDGKWIYPFISWHDNRTLEQLSWLEKKADFKEIYRINGQKPWHLNTIFRNLWVKQNLPEIYKKIYKWLLIEDYINFKLCGEIATDYSLASTTLVFDQKRLDWSDKLFNLFGIDKDIYPDALPSATYLGEVKKDAAELTGLKEGTPVILGGLDGLFGVYAAAGDQNKNLVGVIGTYEHYHKCTDKPIIKIEGLDSSIICQAHVIKSKYGIYGVAVSSGILEWFKDNLGKEEIMVSEKEKKVVWDLLMGEAKNSVPGSNGLFMFPEIFGSTCPIQDPNSKGAFIGISESTKKEDFVRSVIEGLNYKGYELYNAIKNYAEAEDDKIIVTGGATKNDFWMQNKADVYGKIIEVPQIDEATPLGAAMAAGIGVGVYKNFNDAYKKVKKPSKKYYPDPEKHQKYRNYYTNVYKKLYNILKEVNDYISNEIR